MEFVAFVGEDKENWGQVTALMNRMDCEKIVIVKNNKVSGFPASSKCEMIDVDTTKPLVELKKELMTKLKERIGMDFEVALSIASGNGKEHMAIISALLSIPVGIRLVIFSKNGIEFVN